MQLHESSFYSSVSVEGENWLPEIIEGEGGKLRDSSRGHGSSMRANRLRNLGFNRGEGGQGVGEMKVRNYEKLLPLSFLHNRHSRLISSVDSKISYIILNYQYYIQFEGRMQIIFSAKRRNSRL